MSGPDRPFRFVRLYHVQIAIPPGGEALARRFYGEILGLEEIAKPPTMTSSGGCWFVAGDREIHLGVEADFRAAAKAHPGLQVDDIDALAAHLEAAHIPIRWDDRLPGHRRFYVQDLHGNRLEALAPDA